MLAPPTNACGQNGILGWDTEANGENENRFFEWHNGQEKLNEWTGQSF